MTATRTILLGAAFGLVAGAAALAQEAGTTAPAPLDGTTANTMESETGSETGSGLGLDMDLDLDITADVGTETDLPQGEALLAAADELIGARVYDANREWVGEVSELLPATGVDEQRVVIDIGGFLGFGETPVAVDAEAITIAWTEAGGIDHATVAMTEAELEQLANSES